MSYGCEDYSLRHRFHHDMRIFIGFLVAFIIPFALLGLFSGAPVDQDEQAAIDLVEQWLQTLHDDQPADHLWEMEHARTVLYRVHDWEIVSSSASQVNVNVTALDFQNDDQQQEQFRVLLTTNASVDGSPSPPRIRLVSSIDNPNGGRARHTLDFIEAWLCRQRQGNQGAEFWAKEASPSRIDGVTGWRVIKSPDSKLDSSAVIEVMTKTGSGEQLAHTWSIDVKYQSEEDSDLVEPKITRITNLTD